MELKIGAEEWLTLDSIVKAIEPGSTITVHPDAEKRIRDSFACLHEQISHRVPVYGTNTQFGDQVRLFSNGIHDLSEGEYFERIREQQVGLIRSHACGVGPTVPREIVRLTMLLRAHCLSRGYSGISIDCIRLILGFLEKGITPSVRRYGSIGASGDLIPLAMIARAYLGDPIDVLVEGERVSADEALRSNRLRPLRVHLREGIALINGTSFMTAIGGFALFRLKTLLDQAVAAIAMALEALLVVETAYEDFPQKLKNSYHQQKLAKTFREFWIGSKLVERHREYRNTVGLDNNHAPDGSCASALQDVYSVRSACHGLAPFCESIELAEKWIENEMNSVNDNPIIDPDSKDLYESANFMGYYVGLGCDTLTGQVASCSAWIHALIGNLLHPRKSKGLPANLSNDPTKYSGFRPTQILACSLCVQNRALTRNFQTLMIATEGDNQDVNSLGTHSALNLWDSVENLYSLTSILAIIACQALELRGVHRVGDESKQCLEQIRRISLALEGDRPLTSDIDSVKQALENGEILLNHVE